MGLMILTMPSESNLTREIVFRFMDLPPELQNQVYELVLPQGQ